MSFEFILAEKANYPTRLLCRLLEVSASGFYEWCQRQQRPAARTLADRALSEQIREIHQQSRGTYGAPRVHAELRLGEGIQVGRKRVARLMRNAGLEGVYRRRRKGLTRRDPTAELSADLVNRQFKVAGPDRLWVADITEHPTREGKVFLAVVLDAWSRRVIGWAIADHIRSELVVDALQMAIWRRQPVAGTILHTDHGSQYTSWAFGRRLRTAGLLGSMGSVGDAYDNSLVESFFGTLQLELLDRHPWTSRQQLATAIFDYIEAFYNPRRRHSSIGDHSPISYENQHAPIATAA